MSEQKTNIKLYHGSNTIVENPVIVNRFKTLDFGTGFYTTDNETQAQEFAVKVYERRSNIGNPIVNIYNFSGVENLQYLKFDFPDENWLDFVVARRRGVEQLESYDIIIGPVANDDVFGTIVLYENGLIDKQEAIKKFKVKKLYSQYLFCSEKALTKISFEKSYTVK